MTMDDLAVTAPRLAGDQLVPEPLVIPLDVVVREVLGARPYRFRSEGGGSTLDQVFDDVLLAGR